jgi:hypothetical protein
VSLLSASSNVLCINLQFITSWGKTHWVCYTDHICQCLKSDWDTQWHEMPETLNHASAWTLVLCFCSPNSRMQESHTVLITETDSCTPHQMCLTLNRGCFREHCVDFVKSQSHIHGLSYCQKLLCTFQKYL